MRRFVILDRDGTINVERSYLADPDRVELLPRTGAGLRRLRDMGLGLVVVTNQSGVARGLLDLPRLEEIHFRLEALLRGEGIHLDGIYFCPHLPEDHCLCRKPKPGLVHRAARELGFVPADAFVIGDKACDVDLGRGVGATTLLVRTGYGAGTQQDPSVVPDFVVDDLVGAADVIRTCLTLEGEGKSYGNRP